MPILVQKIKVATNASFIPSIFFSPVSSIGSFGLYFFGFFYWLWKNRDLSPHFGPMFVQLYIHANVREKKVS